ncbi:3-deoxy-manno-octulosonate cytidylyltransferase [Candidatus Cloacimonadaceae bacterium]
MNIVAVIPARYASTRFPGKALAMLQGKPLIQHVFERVKASELFDMVVVATDHDQIVETVMGFGGNIVMTPSDLPSGTDRVADALQYLPQADLIVNVQGDEPLVDTSALARLIDAFQSDRVQMASLMTLITDPAMLNNPNIVKLVVDSDDDALYFSRSPIPFNRDGQPGVKYLRHIGIYAYRREVLWRFVRLPQANLEQIEKLEQLRALENGIPIRMVYTDYQGIGVDTPEDLALMEKLMQKSSS